MENHVFLYTDWKYIIHVFLRIDRKHAVHQFGNRLSSFMANSVQNNSLATLEYCGTQMLQISSQQKNYIAVVILHALEAFEICPESEFTVPQSHCRTHT